MAPPLEGIRILDFSQVQAGPQCTQMLADFGAHVLKVERIGGGEGYRSFFPQVRGIHSNWLSLNRNKRSLAVDIQKPEGQGIVRRLVQHYDVLVENFRPGVMDRLGLGYQELSTLNPGLVYAAVSGFGQTGPYRTRKGQDMVAQAMSGLTTMNGGREDPPTLVQVPLADATASILLALGILLALMARERTGVGQFLETNLLDSALFAQVQDISRYMNDNEVPVRAPRGGARPFAGPTSGLYRARDGYIVTNMLFSPGNQVSGMCALLGIPDLACDPRFDTREKVLENYVELQSAFAAEFTKRTVAEWVEVFEKGDAICAPVYSYREVCEDPQVQHNGMITEMDHPKGGRVRSLGNPIQMHGTPWQLRCGPPEVGQDTDETLRDLGYSPEQIADLHERNVVA